MNELADKYHRQEIYLVEPESPDDIVALEYPTREQNTKFDDFFDISPGLATNIRSALKLAGQTNPTCTMLLNFYERGVIEHTDLPALAKLVDELDPPIGNIYHAFWGLEDVGLLPESLAEEFSNAVYAFPAHGTWPVNRLGYFCNFDKDGSVKPRLHSVPDDLNDFYGSYSLESAVAKELGLPAFVGQHELVYKEGKPHILSELEHTTLGNIDQEGNFEPTVTVLDSEHPARNRPEEYYKDRFEDLMAKAIKEHANGNYEVASDLAKQAYYLAPDRSSDASRAARDVSAREDRLGNYDEAEDWAKCAYAAIHRLILRTTEPTRQAYRERAVSAMYIALNSLRIAINSVGDPDNHYAVAANYFRLGLDDIRDAKGLSGKFVDGVVDQYEINMLRHASMTESLVGHKIRGFRLGVKAVLFSSISESPRLSTSNPNLSRKEVFNAKAKALKGGLAALAVSALSSKDRLSGSGSTAIKITSKAL